MGTRNTGKIGGLPLSDMELSIMTLVIDGYTIAQIAEALGKTPGTVKQQLHTIRRVLNAKNLTEAAVIVDRSVRAKNARTSRHRSQSRASEPQRC
jgi:DNA-binding NarL/FixJ family response regulator